MLIQNFNPRPREASFAIDAEQKPILRSQIISALSYALDLTEGQPLGHAARSCTIGMRIAAEIGMREEDAADLYYALLLKDAGCSSNASRMFHLLAADEIRAKRDVKTTDWTRVGWESLQYALSHAASGQPFLTRVRKLAELATSRQDGSRELIQIRCERGGAIARKLGFSEAVAAGIFSLDEHWNGAGYPDALAGTEIPLFSRIMNLAQTLEVFLIQQGPEASLEIARRRAGRWFDPDLVQAAEALHGRQRLFAGLQTTTHMEDVVALEPAAARLTATDAMIDEVCVAFAEIIDAKSPFTYQHSQGVARGAAGIGKQLGMTPAEQQFLVRAGLLHDIGKLAVSNAILEKPGELTRMEFEVIKTHPAYTFQILRRIPVFRRLSEVAAAHHEKLDGSGYFRGMEAGQLSRTARILAVADVYDALSAKRPYRDSLPNERVFGILEEEAPGKLDADCVQALKAWVEQYREPAPSNLDLLALNSAIGMGAAPVRDLRLPGHPLGNQQHIPHSAQVRMP